MRLMTYNIQKGYGGRDQRYNLQRAIDVIEHENPDIICLQEVDHNMKRTKFHNQPDLFRKYFGYRDDYQWNHKIGEGGYGNQILTRFHPLETAHIDLRLHHRKTRGAQLMTINTPEGHVLVVNWHLGLAEKQRQGQVRHFLDHSDYQQFCNLPTIVVGDFNDWRNSLEDLVLHPAGFSQITKPLRKFRSFPAYLPLGSLDKAFVKGGVVIHEVRMVKRKAARIASDHLPLIVDFHLVSSTDVNDI